MEGLMPLKGHFNTGHGIVTPEVKRVQVRHLKRTHPLILTEQLDGVSHYKPANCAKGATTSNRTDPNPMATPGH